MNILANQVMTIRLDCAGTVTTLVRNLHSNIGAPDGVYVRSISYNGANAETMVYSIYTDLVNNHLGAVTQGQSIAPNTYFRLNGANVNGNYTFRIDDTATPSATAQNCFVIVLEFVRWAQQ